MFLGNLFKQFRPILIGIIIFLTGNLMISSIIMFTPWYKNLNFRYGNYMPDKIAQLESSNPNNIDILFLGTSQTNNGFATQAFEKSLSSQVNSFNMGLPNNRYDIMLNYLEWHRKKYGSPKLVLIELGATLQEKNSEEYYLPSLFYRTLFENDPAMLMFALKNSLMSNAVKQELALSSLSILREFRHTFSPLNILNKISGKMKPSIGIIVPSGAEYIEELPIQITINEKMINKGWHPKPVSRMMTTDHGIAMSIDEAEKYYIKPLPEINFGKLKQLMDYCKMHNISIVLVSWPDHPYYTERFSKSHLAASYQKGIKDFSAQYNLPIIDLGKELPDNLTNVFSDPRHLSPEAAIHFSGLLGEKISILPQANIALRQNPKKLTQTLSKQENSYPL